MIINDIIKEIEVTYGETKDYKFFCFGGKVNFFKVDYGRFHQHHANYYSLQGVLMPFGEKAYPPDIKHIELMPKNLLQMIKIAEELSVGYDFLRVDLYNVSGKIYFGELTFYPAGGFGTYIPDEWNMKLGEMLNI